MDSDNDLPPAPTFCGVPVVAIKGRGSATRAPHRFERDAREAFDDGWGPLAVSAGDQTPDAVGGDEGDGEEVAGPATEVRWEDVRSVISRNDSPDIPFDAALNPYRGCEHGCVYCYARPTHSYLNLSPGLDFETRLIAKRNVVEQLRAELAAPRYRPSVLALGSATDCYQPVERRLRLTRGVIELLHGCQHPLEVITKSSGIERDIDLLGPMAARRQAAAFVSITTLDPALARILEPRAASPARRLRTIRALADAGIPVGVSISPQIPFINDDLEQVMEAAWDAGARSAFYIVLRLPWELQDIFQEWLQLHYPQRAERVMARVRDLRGGKTYDADFATRMKGTGLWADLLRQRFMRVVNKRGFNQQRFELDTRAFVRPSLSGQAQLF